MIARLRFPSLLLAAAVLSSLSCASTPHPSREAEYQAALAAAVASIETPPSRRGLDTPSRAVTLVVSSQVPPELRRACMAVRHTVFDYDLPELDTYTLPPGFLQPLSLVASGDTAVFRGILGPVPLPGTPASRSACGTTFTVRLHRQADGSWSSSGGSAEHCGLLQRRPRASAA